ncbi:co-chaperone GroES [Candidatus Uhrbacteria bacterium]|nr:co-chaperone GroES [Candidatus Uhrbacteria bacterium]
MTLRPLHDRVIVKTGTKEEKTSSGILLPDTIDKEKPEQGTVIALGPGRRLDDGSLTTMSVKIGDTVLFKKYSPDEIKLDGQDYLVLSETDILAVIE